MRETIFPSSATFQALKLCGVGKLKRSGEPFQLFYFTEFFPTPFSSETAVTEGEE